MSVTRPRARGDRPHEDPHGLIVPRALQRGVLPERGPIGGAIVDQLLLDHVAHLTRPYERLGIERAGRAAALPAPGSAPAASAASPAAVSRTEPARANASVSVSSQLGQALLLGLRERLVERDPARTGDAGDRGVTRLEEELGPGVGAVVAPLGTELPDQAAVLDDERDVAALQLRGDRGAVRIEQLQEQTVDEQRRVVVEVGQLGVERPRAGDRPELRLRPVRGVRPSAGSRSRSRPTTTVSTTTTAPRRAAGTRTRAQPTRPRTA